MTVSEAGKELEVSRVKNEIAFLSTEIDKSVKELNSMLFDITRLVGYKDGDTNKFSPFSESEEYIYADTSNAKDKQVAYKQKLNHLKSCIGELNSIKQKLPKTESYSEEFIYKFRQEVNKLKQNEETEKRLKSVDDATATAKPESLYTKSKSGIIVPNKNIIRDNNMIRVKVADGRPIQSSTDVQLTTNWKLSDFDDRPPYNKRVPAEYVKYTKLLATGLESMAKTLGYKKLTCTSGYRTRSHQSSCNGGFMSSLHTYGAAADITHFGKKSQFWDAAGKAGFTSIILYPGGGWIHVDVRAQCDARLSVVGGATHYYSKDGAHSYTSNMESGWRDGVSGSEGDFVAGGGGTSGGFVIPVGDGYINGLNVKDLYESDNYYGYGERQDVSIKIGGTSISKIVLNSSASTATVASTLNMTEDALVQLNPTLTKGTILYSGMTLYVPSSTTTEMDSLITDAYNAVSAQEMALHYSASNYAEAIGSGLYAGSSTIDEDTKNAIIESVINEYDMPKTATSKAIASKAISTSQLANTKTAIASKANQGQLFDKEIANQYNKGDVKTNNAKISDYKELLKIAGMNPVKGYTSARLLINDGGKVRVVKMAINPIAYNETYSTSVNLHQTTGGWFISRHGENPTNLTINGYLLDTDMAAEKHSLIKEWQNYLTDKVDSKGNFYNKNTAEIQLEGVRYKGIVNSLNFSRDASRPLLYTFQLSFTCLTYKVTREIDSAMARLNSTATQARKTTTTYLSNKLSSTLKK